MITVLIVDGGKGAKVVGEYIEQELPVETIPISIECEKMTEGEVADTLMNAIRPYKRTVGVAVLMGGYLTRGVERTLACRLPEIDFVNFDDGFCRLAGNEERVMIVTSGEIRRSEEYQTEKAKMQECEIVELDFEEWRKAASGDSEAIRRVQQETISQSAAKIIIHSTEILAEIDKVKQIIDWRAEIIDMRIETAKRVEKSLGMRQRRDVRSRGRVAYREKKPFRVMMAGQW
ncbi:hypothetical protein IJG78_03990 [Candidatus Saccharibacteria bacterium]|nr:hypothetical protein [Candidatus Saccharibacteria bacterium]